ncbi:halocyanin-like protein (copper-containing protein) 2 [Halobiforma lacisalsi AJ5]|uniref:Halocyanin-like protein (Copper-containing protein) 2 n=1 Tax=Natronobacterium lacisalsi AJ5 TaxID=358396 RepID=M0LDH8_NATLA|nr:plastocyanin/azurin family copper-binding protein [Halobiforma lacisalsi]EMA31173.1 halocyanin-like protein (copper-containing protein) 2 [Halobiforma lacisalsi AJ5]
MTPVTRRTVLQASASAVGIALVGCLESTADRLGGAEGDGTGELGSPTDRITVTANSQPYPEFEPQIVHVVPGGTVEWLVETGRHDVTAYHEDGHGPHRTPNGVETWGSRRLTGVGSSYERTFDQEGVYDYVDTQQVCTSHEIAGNIGRVVVGWPDPDPDAEPAMADPQPGLPSQAARAIELFNEKTRPVLEAGP